MNGYMCGVCPSTQCSCSHRNEYNKTELIKCIVCAKSKKKKTPDVTQVININRKTDLFVSLRCYYVNQIIQTQQALFSSHLMHSNAFHHFQIFIGNSDCFVAEAQSVEFSTHMCNGHQYVCKRQVKSKVYRNLFLTHIYIRTNIVCKRHTTTHERWSPSPLALCESCTYSCLYSLYAGVDAFHFVSIAQRAYVPVSVALRVCVYWVNKILVASVVGFDFTKA